MEQERVEFLHRKSLLLGEWFRKAHERFGPDSPVTRSYLDAYRAVRRQLPGELDADGHSTRYGAREAYEVTQD
jgi:hypothetical protein